MARCEGLLGIQAVLTQSTDLPSRRQVLGKMPQKVFNMQRLYKKPPRSLELWTDKDAGEEQFLHGGFQKLRGLF